MDEPPDDLFGEDEEFAPQDPQNPQNPFRGFSDLFAEVAPYGACRDACIQNAMGIDPDKFWEWDKKEISKYVDNWFTLATELETKFGPKLKEEGENPE